MFQPTTMQIFYLPPSYYILCFWGFISYIYFKELYRHLVWGMRKILILLQWVLWFKVFSGEWRWSGGRRWWVLWFLDYRVYYAGDSWSLLQPKVGFDSLLMTNTISKNWSSFDHLIFQLAEVPTNEGTWFSHVLAFGRLKLWLWLTTVS